MMTLYHGSYLSIPAPLAKAGRKNLDFGHGFYVTDTVEDYEKGIITAEQALGQLRYKKVNHQICILNQSVIDKYLEYIESISLNVEED